GARYGHSTRPPCERIPPIRTTSWRVSRFQSGEHKPPTKPRNSRRLHVARGGHSRKPVAKSGETTKRGGLTHDRAGARAGQGSAGNHRGAYAASPSRTGRRGRGRRGRG